MGSQGWDDPGDLSPLFLVLAGPFFEWLNSNLMETLIQKATRLRLRQEANEQGNLGPFEGVIVSVTPEADTVGVTFGPARERRMPIQHPFNGSSSWIRSVPEVNTRLLMQNRYDSKQPEALKTIPFPSEMRAGDYLKQTNAYRTLSAGEHDIASSGLALAYFSRRGHVDLRSGHAVKSSMNRETLSIEDSAPTHVKNLLLNTVGELGDEERLGIVKRWKTAVDHEYIQDANNNFQAEHYIHLKNPAGSAPFVLLEKTEGQVYDESGERLNQASTNLPLRHQSLFYTTTDEVLRIEVDENGNQVVQYPSTATTGFEMVIPNGSYKAEMINRDITIKGDEQVSVTGNIQYQVQGGVNYDVTKSLNVVAGNNALTMDVTEGEETVGLVNSNLLGFQAENTSDGGLTSVFGPNNSGIFMNGEGKVQIQDGLGGGAIFEGATITIFGSGGAKLGVGDSVILSGSSGTDFLSIDSGKVQLSSSKDISLIGSALSANVGSLYLGVNASIPAVLGLSLLGWLDTHFHTTLSGPSTPPTIPSSAFTGTPLSLVSMSVFLPPSL